MRAFLLANGYGGMIGFFDGVASEQNRIAAKRLAGEHLSVAESQFSDMAEQLFAGLDQISWHKDWTAT